MVPSSSLASERGGRSCCRRYWKPRRGKEVAWQWPPARASHCLCSSGLGSRWLLGVTNGKYTILSRQSRQKASKDRDAHKDSFPIPLLNYLGPERDVGAAQIARGESVGAGEVPSQEEKREHCISSSFSLGEKENFRSPGRSISLGKHKEPGLS